MVFAGIIGGQEIIILLILILVVTGGSFLPRLMRNMGEKVKKINDATKDTDEKIADTMNEILKKHGNTN